MNNQKITLGQLVNLLLESGINLNEILLKEDQTQAIQDNLQPKQITDIASFTQSEINKLSDDVLDTVAGGLASEDKEKILTTIKTGAKYVGKALGYGVFTVGLLHVCASVLSFIKPDFGGSYLRFGPQGEGITIGSNGRPYIQIGAYN